MAGRSRWVGRVAGIALVALAAACSSGGDSTTAPPPTATTATVPTGTPDASPTPPDADVADPVVADPGPPPLPPLDQGQLLMFGAVPPKPESVDYRIPLGSADYFELFAPGAPWTDALEHIDLFRLHAFQMRHYLNDADLRLIIDWLDEHQIPLLFETEPLQPPDPAECDHSESFEGPYDLEMAQRFKDLGGHIAVVAIEQPFTFAHQLRGPRVCHYSLERIVGEVTDYMTEMRKIFPGVPMGSIEGLVRDPVTAPEDMALWIDSYEALAGEPLEFLHIDVDWTVPGWTEILRGIEQVADERNVPFGVLYNGWFEPTSERWLQRTAQHFAEYETTAGGSVDHVTLVSWVDQPDRVLPDDDLGAFTSLINRYAGIRSEFGPLEAVPADADAPAQLRGRLVDATGAGLGGQEITASILEADPVAATATVSGVVPDDATEAAILIRANVEDAVRGPTDFRVYEVHYSEDGSVTNIVGNGDFSDGTTWWYFDGDPIGDAGIVTTDADLDVGSGSMLSVTTTADQIVFVNGESFPVTPGAEFDFSATFAFDPTAAGVGAVSVAFLNPDTRTTIRIQPVAAPVPAVVTDDDGAFVVPLPPLNGPATIDLIATGDLETWPALASTSVAG